MKPKSDDGLWFETRPTLDGVRLTPSPGSHVTHLVYLNEFNMPDRAGCRIATSRLGDASDCSAEDAARRPTCRRCGLEWDRTSEVEREKSRFNSAMMRCGGNATAAAIFAAAPTRLPSKVPADRDLTSLATHVVRLHEKLAEVCMSTADMAQRDGKRGLVLMFRHVVVVGLVVTAVEMYAAIQAAANAGVPVTINDAVSPHRIWFVCEDGCTEAGFGVFTSGDAMLELPINAPGGSA